MTKAILKSIVALLFTSNCFATANFVYHEQTLTRIGAGCGTYVSTISPSSTSVVTIEFLIGYQTFTNQARIYYTTDGSIPSASFGVVSGTTKAIIASYYCSYDDGSGIVDVARGTIPACSAGATVKYIVSAWKTSGGLEIFGNSNVAATTVFSYTVGGSTLPLKLVNFSAKNNNNKADLSWISEQEINADRYEIYQSENGSDFKNIGVKNALGNTSAPTEYSFTDARPAKGNNFYKIKSIGKNGVSFYSNIIKVAFNENGSVSIKKIGNDLHIELLAMPKDNYAVRVINNYGQTIKSYTIYHDGNSEDHIITLPQDLSKNIYRISVTGKKSIYAQSLFK